MNIIEFDKNKIYNVRKKIVNDFINNTNNTLLEVRDSVFITTISFTKDYIDSPLELLNKYKNTNIYYIGLDNINNNILNDDYKFDSFNITNNKSIPNSKYILILGFTDLNFSPIFNKDKYINNSNIIGYIYDNKLYKNNNYINRHKYNREFNIYNNLICNYDYKNNMIEIQNKLLYFLDLIIKYNFRLDLDSYNFMADQYLELLKIIRKFQKEK